MDRKVTTSVVERKNITVIALDKRKKPLGFVTPKRARKLLESNRAAIHRMYPFIIRIKDMDVRDCDTKEFRLKIDPGSKYTGFSIIDDLGNVYFLAELEHRGSVVKDKLKTRAGARRNRETEKLDIEDLSLVTK